MLLELFYGEQLISKPLFKLKIIEMKICRCSQIPLNIHSYHMVALETEVATVGLLCLLIKILFLDVVDKKYIINVIKLLMIVTRI